MSKDIATLEKELNEMLASGEAVEAAEGDRSYSERIYDVTFEDGSRVRHHQSAARRRKLAEWPSSNSSTSPSSSPSRARDLKNGRRVQSYCARRASTIRSPSAERLT